MEIGLAARLKVSSVAVAQLLMRPQGIRRKGPLSIAITSCCAAALIFPVPQARQDSWGQIAVGNARASPLEAGTLSSIPPHTGNNQMLSSVLVEAMSSAPALVDALPFRYSGNDANRARATECLAAAAWYEIGNDREGQRAVIQTVINRVNHPGFPNSVCGVVFQGSHRRTGCQFTFTCDGSLLRRRPSARSWQNALEVAEDALDGFVDTSIGTATHYHADYVVPWWSAHLQRLTAVGPHIFYRWSGNRGNFSRRVRLDAEQEYQALVRKSTESASDNSSAAAIGDEATSDLATPAAALATPGMMAHPAPSTGSAIVLALESSQPSGRWAITAMQACKGKSDCQVLGYDNAGLVRANQARSPGTRDRPAFLFVRDAASGMNLALWDCVKFERPQTSQCLPSDERALRKLMAERS